MEGNKKAPTTSVLMLPWLAHGHISPFLELAKKLADRNYHIYICSTPINLQSITKKITPKYANSIQLLPYHIPESPDLPLHYHTTKGLPPHLMSTLKNEYEKASPQFSTLITKIHPDLVIYDFNQPWAAEMAILQKIPAVQFMVGGACLIGFFWYMMNSPQTQFPYPEIHFKGYELKKMADLSESEGHDNMEKDFKRFAEATRNSCSLLLVKTCNEIEEKYIEFSGKLWGKKVVPVGQLVEDCISTNNKDEEQSEIIKWLGKKEKESTVFVSFGSEYFLNKEDRYEIAKGLELSGVNFIWVIRFDKGNKIKIQEQEDVFPDGFLERVKDRGIFVEGWAPQARILKHMNTGGFLSHCGWSSVMESMKYGVPIIALPMHIDQPLIARFVEAVGVGLEAIRDEEGKLLSKEIGETIRKVMVEESGEEVRKKVKDLSKKVEMKGDEEIDNLVVEIRQLCQKFNSK